MDKEYIVLNHIHQGGELTQREMARDAGISVGAVNLLIKKLVKKGLVKIERLNPKTLRYILTPKGMQEKVKRTYDFARSSYRRIALISEGVKVLVEERQSQDPGLEEVVLFGPQDEVREIIKMGLVGAGVGYVCCMDEDCVEAYMGDGKTGKRLCLVWRVEEEGVLRERRYEGENVLGRVGF